MNEPAALPEPIPHHPGTFRNGVPVPSGAIGFDDTGRPTPTVEHPTREVEAFDAARWSPEVRAALKRAMATGVRVALGVVLGDSKRPTPEAVGRRALLVGYATAHPGVPANDQRALARLLGVQPLAACRALAAIEADLADYMATTSGEMPRSQGFLREKCAKG